MSKLIYLENLLNILKHKLMLNLNRFLQLILSFSIVCISCFKAFFICSKFSLAFIEYLLCWLWFTLNPTACSKLINFSLILLDSCLCFCSIFNKFKYNSLKVWLPSLGWRLKKDLNIIPVSFFVESNLYNLGQLYFYLNL